MKKSNSADNSHSHLEPEIISLYTITPSTSDNVCIINPITLSVAIVICFTLVYFLNKKISNFGKKYVITK